MGTDRESLLKDGAIFAAILVVCVAAFVPKQSTTAEPSGERSLVLEQYPTSAEYGDDGWFVSGGGRAVYAVYRDTAVQHDGHAAWTLAPIENTYGKYGTWMRATDSAPYIGKRIRITASTRTQGAIVRADVWARVQAKGSPGDGSGLVGDWVKLEPTSDWTTSTIVMDVPFGGVSVQYGVGIAGPGSIWFEPLTLEVVGLDVPVTTNP
jgi:hypothetical protein